jgi:ACS family pantothenate transporter-like MFS transporter
MADVTRHDLQLRAITTGFMNSFDFAFVTWWPLIFYPVTDAPNYRKGYIASIVTGALIIPLVLLIAFLEKQGVQRETLGLDFESDQANERRSDEQEASVVTVEAPNKS